MSSRERCDCGGNTVASASVTTWRRATVIPAIGGRSRDDTSAASTATTTTCEVEKALINREFFLHLVPDQETLVGDDLEAALRKAVAE